jgi:hypothetical protein
MNERAHRMTVVLDAYARRHVPDDLDLWPQIQARLQIQRGQTEQRLKRAGIRCGPALRRVAPMLLAAGLLVVPLLITELWPDVQRRHAAARVLLALSEVAAAQPVEQTAAQSGYRYTKSEGAYLSTMAGPNTPPFSVLVPKTRELWIAPDGSGRLRETPGEPIFLGERDRARWQAAGRPQVVFTRSRDFTPGELHYEDLATLPTDPQALAAVIRQRATIPSGPPVDVEMFILVGALLRETAAPPALRAALYQVAAQIPGVELVGTVTDRAGRTGVAVAKTTSHFGSKQRLVLIFDPATSALLGEERVLLEPVDWLDAKPPVVISYTTYLESRIVLALP